jgi:major membrane immunogen (membrane-anchored lipoprotein)
LNRLLHILSASLIAAVPFFAASAFGQVSVSSPSNGATVTSPVHFVATASAPNCGSGVSAMGIYVNNQLVYTVNGNSLNTSLSMNPGSYYVVVQEWDNCGGATTSPLNLTVSSGQSGVSVSSPSNGSTVTSPVHYVATATAPSCSSGVAAMGIYTAPGQLAYSVNGNSLNTSLTLNPGTYNTVVQEWDNCGGAANTPVTITVSGSSGSPVSVSTPANGSTVTSPVHYVATATAPSCSSGVAAMGIYTAPGQLAYSVNGNSLNTSLTLNPGTYNTVVQEWDNCGGAANTPVTITVSGSSNSPVSVSSPANNSTVTSPVHYVATATAPSCSSGVASMGIYVNSQLDYVVNGASLNTNLSLNPGTYNTVVQEWDNCGNAANTPVNITVSGSSYTPGTANITTWHYDNNRSGNNPNEPTLNSSNVNSQSFGKLFSYLVDGYVYGEPLLMSNVTINGAKHNVVYVATENDSVYALDGDNFGAPLWKTSLLKQGETPVTTGVIQPVQGVTSTPVIDPSTNTLYVVSVQQSGGNSFFRLSALDITTGAQKFGGPVTIQASVPGNNSDSVNGVDYLTTACIQRAALLLANGNVYMGFGGCHSGWLLAYKASNLSQVGVWNASPNLNGEGAYASAGGVWMGSAGPVADSSGNIYVTTGNGPWDGSTAFGDSVLKFSPTLKLEDYFTPYDYQFMNCSDADLAAGGLLLIPGTSELVAGGKTGKLYMVNSGNLGHEQANDAGATQTLWFEPDLSAPWSKSCTDSTGTHTTQVNSFEIYGGAAYYNNYVYLGISPTANEVIAPVRQFEYSGTLTPGAYTEPSVQQNTRGTTPFISSNGDKNGILWMIDEGQPIQGPNTPTSAILRAYDADQFPNALYDTTQNAADTPGYGIKFSSPIVANGKVYISTGHDLPSAGSPQGEIDVYGLK